jgi:hypothetical protein
MSGAALTLLVLIASGDGGRDATGPVATSMARAVKEAVGGDAQVVIREVPKVPSDDDAISSGRIPSTAAPRCIFMPSPALRAGPIARSGSTPPTPTPSAVV